MKRRTHILALAAALLFSVLPPRANALEGPFAPIRTYGEQFSDVSRSDWFYDNVKALYELGLTNGKGSVSCFDPNGDLTGAEVLVMAARLRSLYETGDSEAGPSAFNSSGVWYLPYVNYLREAGVIGRELESAYSRPATRAEMAHVLANALPSELFEPVNEETVASGYEAGQYITDVTDDTPYADDILQLYTWGIAGGTDQTGSFLPDSHISRCQAAAMVARLAYSELRVTLDWVIRPAYYVDDVTLAGLIYSDGAFFEDPSPDEKEKIDADVRYMLSRGERRLSLQYPSGTLSKSYADALTRSFLEAARNYVEQTYNSVYISYSSSAGYVSMSFSSSLYSENQIDYYRDATLDYAIKVHNQLWESGELTADMSQYDKAKVYFAWICNNCRYDHSTSTKSMSHTGYRLFAEQLAVCDGYTAAYNLLLKLEGIDCGTYSTADHIWTTATLDGQEYHIDTTWGDQSGGVDYRYFAMTEADAAARF